MGFYERAQRAWNDLCTKRDAALEAFDALAEDASEELRTATLAAAEAAQKEVADAEPEFLRLKAIHEGRRALAPVVIDPEAVPAPAAALPATPASPKGANEDNERTYRPDKGFSFFRDLVMAKSDGGAQARLLRNQEEIRVTMEERAVSVTTDGQFIPPIYLGDQWANLPRKGRPFANVIPTFPFPPDGLTVTIPKVSGGATVAAQAQGGAVSSTDPTVTDVTHTLVTIAGQVDIARQAIERSFPGLDMVIFNDLMRAYDGELDRQLLNGLTGNNEHMGIRNVSSVNTEAYTDGSPTQAKLVPKLYEASSKVATNRYLPADLIVMHPSRAAWLAAGLSSTFPLFQQGALFQAVGTQNDSYVGTIAGLPVVADPNVITTANPGTNQDEIYVLHVEDLLLAESPYRSATYEDVLSGNLQVRLQLYGYSFFVADRQAKSICVVSGTGLATPSF